MAHQLFQLSLKVFIKNEKGEVLCLEEPATGKNAGTFDFPGGRVDETEMKASFADCLAREILEEVGPDIKYKINPKPVAVARQYIAPEGKEIPVLWLVFEAKYLSGEVKISEEHASYKWLKLEEIDLEKTFRRASLEATKNYLGR